MTDVVDKACELEQKQREQALAAARVTIEKPKELHGHRYCLDCDLELDTNRLIANPKAVRCVDCQTLLEHKNKRFYP
ncbi:hypothetical protein A9Q74_06230 [Colwellia sp. 39_35_sub15_T18]|nr:hypothetical protein A9Q74_06230 [Colwellia sp. 39_35_sub15_T18]